MSTNYNTPLLRSLKAPLMEGLATIANQLEDITSGRMDPSKLTAVSNAHEITGSLKIIGCQSVTRVAKTIEDVAKDVRDHDLRGWDRMRAQAVSRVLLEAVKAFERHLQDMLGDAVEPHVFLWPTWSALHKAVDAPRPVIEDLYEPAPNFEDERFRRMDPTRLRDLVAAAHDRLKRAIGTVRAGSSVVEVEQGLRQALEVFDQVYGFRHRRSYQAYWLIVRGRLAVGLLRAPASLEDKEQWVDLLDDAAVELRKFGEDHPKIRPERLSQTVRPLLAPWPEEWAVAHPVLADLDRRLGLSEFRRGAAAVQSQNASSLDAFASRHAELAEGVTQLRNGWTNYSSASNEQRKAALNVFLKAVAQFLPKQPLFPGPQAQPLLDVLRELGDELTPHLQDVVPTVVDVNISMETASLLLLLGEAIERRGHWNEEFEKQSALQKLRLQTALAGRHADLQRLPALRWDSRWRGRQVRHAISLALEQIRANLKVVEDVLVEWSSDEDSDAKERFEELMGRCRLSGRALKTLRYPEAAQICEGIVEQLNQLKRATEPTPPSPEMAQALASLNRFLTAVQNGEEEAPQVLQGALKAFGRSVAESEDRHYVPVKVELPELTSSPVPSAPHVSSSQTHVASAPVAELAQEHSSSFEDPAAKIAALSAQDIEDLLLGAGWIDKPNDEEIARFFLEEAVMIFGEIQSQRTLLGSNPYDTEAITTIRRQFHTLKGSGRLCGLVGLGEVSWWVERRLNEALTQGESYHQNLDRLVEEAIHVLAPALERLGQSHQLETPIQASSVKQALDASFPPVASVPAFELEDQVDITEAASPITSLDAEEGEFVSFPLSAGPSLEELLQGSAEDEASTFGSSELPISSLSDEQDAEAHEVFELFKADALEHRQNLQLALDVLEQTGALDLRRLHLSSHTLASLGALVGAAALLELGKAVELRTESLLESGQPLEPHQTSALSEAVHRLASLAQAAVLREEQEAAPAELLEHLTDDSAWLPAPSVEAGLSLETVEPETVGVAQEEDWQLDLPPTDSVCVQLPGLAAEPWAVEHAEIVHVSAVDVEAQSAAEAISPAENSEEASSVFALEDQKLLAAVRAEDETSGVEDEALLLTAEAQATDQTVVSAVPATNDMTDLYEVLDERVGDALEHVQQEADLRLESVVDASAPEELEAALLVEAEQAQALASEEEEVQAEAIAEAAAVDEERKEWGVPLSVQNAMGEEILPVAVGEEDAEPTVREQAWDRVFVALEQLNAGIHSLSQALMDLNDTEDSE